MTEVQTPVASAPFDVAKHVYEDAVAGNISIDTALAALEKHLCSTTGKGRRAAQLEAWIADLESKR